MGVLEEWSEALHKFEEHVSEKDSSFMALRDRIRRSGVPHNLRKVVWPVLCGSKAKQAASPGVFLQCLNEFDEDTSPYTKIIGDVWQARSLFGQN